MSRIVAFSLLLAQVLAPAHAQSPRVDLHPDLYAEHLAPGVWREVSWTEMEGSAE